jgi:hypothetical protein
MPQDRRADVLQAAADLFGVCILLIVGLRIAGAIDATLLDEIAMAAAAGFAASCIFSLIATHCENCVIDGDLVAGIAFVLSTITLLTAVVMFAGGGL